MKQVKLVDFLNKSQSYEKEYPAPFDRRLSQAVKWGAISIPTTALFSIFLLPLLAQFLGLKFFLLVPDLFFGLVDFSGTSALIGVAIAVLGAYPFYRFYHHTKGLTEGNLFNQRIGVGIAGCGAIHLVTVGLPMLIAAVNLLIWTVMIVAIIGGVIGALGSRR